MKVWQCPGPAALVGSMADALVDGRSVIARIPPLTPPGLDDELVAALNAGGWAIIRINDDGRAPARQILEAGEVREVLSREVDAAIVAESLALADRIFYCAPGDADAARRWLAFLDQYAVACRARRGSNCARFILSLTGALACPAPTKKVGVEVMDVGSAVSPTDALLLAYFQTGMSLGDSTKAQVIAQTAASVALWDVALLHRLLDAPPASLFAPMALLTDYATENGWTARTERSWPTGVVRHRNGREEIHSAHLAFDDPNDIVASRVWAGQAAVLLPAIERRRLELVQEYRPFFESQLPIMTEYERISDPADLEMGHLARLLSSKPGASAAGNLAFRLKFIRNKLAHLTPLLPEEAFAPELLAC